MKEETDFYASYGNEALEKVQSTLWEILLQVDSILRKIIFDISCLTAHY